MELILAAIILSLATNIDNLAIGVAYGLRKIIITFHANFIIAILSGMSTFTAMYFGESISQVLSENLASSLGSLILVGIGSWGVWETFNPQSHHLACSEVDLQNPIELMQSGDFAETKTAISVKEAALLGLGLTITNLGTGVGAGIAQFDIILTSSLSVCSSLLTIGGGYLIGKILTANFSAHGLGLISGSLLIILGLVNLST